MASKPTPQMRRLARTRLDQTGDWLRQMLPRLQSAPRGGWIAATRDALGMSRSDLARRLGVSPSSVLKLENSERAGTVQVDTLRRAAAALDCELVVLVVPRQPLQSRVDQQRLKLYNATFNLEKVSGTIPRWRGSRVKRGSVAMGIDAKVDSDPCFRPLFSLTQGMSW